MKKFKISVRIDGIKKEEIIEAQSRDKALEIAWSKYDVDDIWVEEVE